MQSAETGATERGVHMVRRASSAPEDKGMRVLVLSNKADNYALDLNGRPRFDDNWLHGRV